MGHRIAARCHGPFPSGLSDDPRLMGRSSDAPRAQSIFGAPTSGSSNRRTPDRGSLSTCWFTFSFVNTGRPGDKLMTASPFFEHGMHSTEWGRKTHHEPAPKTGLRAQLARGFHLTLGSLRVLATEPRLMALPFLALVFTGFVWLIVVLSVLALGLPPASPSSGFLYQEMFVAYLVTYFLSVYFMAAIIGAAPSCASAGAPTRAASSGPDSCSSSYSWSASSRSYGESSESPAA